ncbi:MAG TPA: hypothetical protein VN721_10800 [Flavipsychrobacter sp.]|nr:hypothetical protein [Flavipsychrobacter sp.]
MAGDIEIQEAAQTLQNDWSIQLPDIISEEAILKQLANRVIELLEKGPEEFFQLMYRLDISEKKLNAVMNEEDVAYRIARLIYDRQLQKIQSRKANKEQASSTDPDLEW